jgi:iron-sulfur cluster repair protein YtfE (RIC family)
MRRLASGYSPRTGASPDVQELFLSLERLEADLRRHIYLEDDVLFPQASALEASLIH